MNLCLASNDIPGQSIFIANSEALYENKWESIKDFLIWTFDSQYMRVTDQEYKYIDFSMTYDSQQGMVSFHMMAFIIQYSHISRSMSDTQGHRCHSGGAPLKSFKLHQWKCSMPPESQPQIWKVPALSGQLCLSTCLDL